MVHNSPRQLTTEEVRAATLTAAHAGTPQIMDFDALAGRSLPPMIWVAATWLKPA